MIDIGLNHIRKHALHTVGCLAAATVLCACIKEEIPAFDDREGQPTTIEVALVLPEMDVRTRAMMSAEDDSQVNTLWVGTYQASTGNRTGYDVYTADHHDQHTPHPLTLATKSGQSHIVGVANIDNNYGTTDNDALSKALKDAGKPQTAAGYYILRDLLEYATTWEQYKSIKAAHINPANVSSFTPNLIMAGIYHDQRTTDPTMWDDETTVQIPAAQDKKVTLPGAIHLRRLLAYVRFDITWPDNLDVDLKSWRVVNNPTFSFLHEQEANAGDAVWETGYAASNLSRNFTSGTGNTRTFDFYQYENRHTGLDDVDDYAAREREHKLDGGSNSGIYTSLCADAVDGPNNRATYVEIEAEVAYTTMNGETTVDRTGTARYVIHLGYCEGNDTPAKAKDFNCRRNTKYTYKVEIRGLDKIVVEARKEGEEQPGAEGEVFDTYEQTIDLDAHYGTFNIQLTNQERHSLDYTIYAPYGETAQNIASDQLRKAHPELEAYLKAEGLDPYYQWIRFRPTTGENVLAKYKSSATDSEPWTLEQLRDVAGHPHTSGDNATDPYDESQRWYTVFVDEYVYHGDTDDGNETGNEWWHYVNQDPRTVYLAIRESNVSEDGESRYGYSKYLIRQQSIQTYYATSTVGGSQIAARALGAEHTNETYGLNLRWTNRATDAAPSDTPTVTGSQFVGYGWNPDNGRVNIWQYLNDGGNGLQWNTYFVINNNTLTQGEIPAQSQLSNVPDPVVQPKSGKYYLPQLRTIRGRNPNSGHNTAYNYALDPNTSNNFYEVMELCLSRNRDLNGNGTIDPEEMRWYLPALGKYTRMVLGRQSLKDPLINPNNFNVADFPGQNGDSSNPWFHYVSSDGMVLLNEQGLSLERKGVTGEDWMNSAWQVRCIRNLGCNLTEVVENDPVQPAYTINTTDRTVEMTYYDQSSIRQQAVDVIPVHPITSEWNLPYKKFQYAREDCTTSETGYNATISYVSAEAGYAIRLRNEPNAIYAQINASHWQDSNNANSICGQYSEEADGSDKGKWRVPNQKELTIMRRGRDEVFTTLPSAKWMWQWISCSRFILGTDTRIAGIYFNNARLDGSQQYWGNGYIEYHTNATGWGRANNTFVHVRCVRDVVE